MLRPPPSSTLFPYTTLFRSSLVTAEVDVTVIRSWLGHASLDTTNIYARANVEAKRKALEKVDGAARSSKPPRDRKSTRLNSSHRTISYAVFCLKKKKNQK